jgi:toxin CcdB
MARLDVHARRDNRAGYLLDVQADLLSGLNTRLVVPLLPRADARHPQRG